MVQAKLVLLRSKALLETIKSKLYPVVVTAGWGLRMEKVMRAQILMDFSYRRFTTQSSADEAQRR